MNSQTPYEPPSVKRVTCTWKTARPPPCARPDRRPEQRSHLPRALSTQLTHGLVT